MHTRRSFLKNSSLFTAGILAAPSFPSLMKARKWDIGLQLYTVRDAMEKDPAATLARVAQIGYNTVEGTYAPGAAKFYGMDTGTFAAMLKQNGLTMISGHYRLGEDAPDGEMKMEGTLEHNWDKAVKRELFLRNERLVCMVVFLNMEDRYSR